MLAPSCMPRATRVRGPNCAWHSNRERPVRVRAGGRKSAPTPPRAAFDNSSARRGAEPWAGEPQHPERGNAVSQERGASAQCSVRLSAQTMGALPKRIVAGAVGFPSPAPRIFPAMRFSAASPNGRPIRREVRRTRAMARRAAAPARSRAAVLAGSRWLARRRPAAGRRKTPVRRRWLAIGPRPRCPAARSHTGLGPCGQVPVLG